MKEVELDFTQKMADELNDIAKKLGLPQDYKPKKLKCLFG